MNNKHVNIVVIDSGIDKLHPIFMGAKIDGVCFFNDNNDFIISAYDIIDEIGHGTAVCGIIKKFCMSAEIFVIKIYKNILTPDENLLVHALNYVYENIECDIINMSLGILTPSVQLHNVCKKLHEKGVIIVSAFDNTGAVSYPAAYGEVIGVDSSTKCIHPEDYIYVKNGMVNLYAKSGNTRLAWLNKKYIISQGVSYSAALATAQIANYIKNNELNFNNSDSIHKLLSQNAINVYKYENPNQFTLRSSNKMFAMKKVAVFPYNKEIHSLINFADLLSFEIENIYDLKQHGYINKSIRSVDETKEFIVKDYLNIDFNTINAMIIGHLSELSALAKLNLKRYLLEKCLEHEVNVYCFDDNYVDEYIEEYRNRGLHIFYPFIGENVRCIKKAGKLYGINSPIIGVFGTSSSQGKYTLQLQLRKLFLYNQYRIGQLGTEPSAFLFGMDNIFAFGYSSTVELNGIEYIEAINELIHQIAEKDPDVILVGCQSNTIPKIYYNIDHINIPQLNFLLGSNPDVVILCVNIDDDINYIRRCILAIENLIECKIPVIAISPLYFPDEWHMINNKKVIADINQMSNFKRQLKTTFDLEAFIIGTEEIVELFDICVDFLSS